MRTRLSSLFIVIILLDVFSTSDVRSGHYTQLCHGMTFDPSSLNVCLDEVQTSSWKECVTHCLHHSKCISITFNSQIMNDVNCMLYSDETVSCMSGHSDVIITIKVGQPSTRS